MKYLNKKQYKTMDKNKIIECLQEAKAHLGNVTTFNPTLDDEISEAYIYLSEALDLLEGE